MKASCVAASGVGAVRGVPGTTPPSFQALVLKGGDTGVMEASVEGDNSALLEALVWRPVSCA